MGEQLLLGRRAGRREQLDNPWSVLAPQALEGVAAVAILYAAVRRVSGPVAALLAGSIMALTPASARTR